MTEIDLDLQVAGHRRTAEALRAALRSGYYQRLRVMVAFIRWSGISLIHEELEAFTEDGQLEIVAGIDLGGTTAEALEYLMRLPNTKFQIFRSGRPQVVFHPKAFSFDGPDGWTTIFGSANWTSGGMFSNVELVASITGVRDEPNPFDRVWSQLTDPQTPIETHHLSTVDANLLDSLAPSLDRYSNRSPDRGHERADDTTQPIAMDNWPTNPGRPPDLGNDLQQTDHLPNSDPVEGHLYMEVWEETGGGTQVQFPKKVIEQYFQARSGTITWLRLETPSGTETQRIQAFNNNTFRIPLRFLSGVPRPAVLKMTRLGDDHYEADVRSQYERGYKTWLSRCDARTRSDSKSFGFRSAR